MKKSPIAKRSAKYAAKLRRSMGTLARRTFVAHLPCAACGITGYSQNAHLLGNDGIGRKKPAETIGPLCGNRIDIVGCHTLYDQYRWDFDKRFPQFDPARVAETTEQLWQAHLHRKHHP